MREFSRLIALSGSRPGPSDGSHGGGTDAFRKEGMPNTAANSERARRGARLSVLSP